LLKNYQNPEHVVEIESDQEIMHGHDNQSDTQEPTDNTQEPTDNTQEPTDNTQEPTVTDNAQESTDNNETSVNDQEAVVNENDLLLATSASVMITVSTKDDDNMDSDESDFAYEQSEQMNYFFISKYATEE
jgi:hypothetical protein